ncbi:Vacuolar protein sorting-associated protein vps5 [Polyrhizophydium stewartii]|uniref:Vacuolar protein sorting-associated protein vps5 n=1 Tax=Polyrhizophydium stewartii TaxID=2732419 RepID=A0ABR4MXX7_9FUNG
MSGLDDPFDAGVWADPPIPNPLFDDPLTLESRQPPRPAPPPALAGVLPVGPLDLGPLGPAPPLQTPPLLAKAVSVAHPLDDPIGGLSAALSPARAPGATAAAVDDAASTRPVPPSDTSAMSDDDAGVRQRLAVDAFFDPLLSPLRNPASAATDTDTDDNRSTSNLLEQDVQNGLAAVYAFEVNVTEPFKTTSPEYRNSEFVSVRRFSDFLWLYNQLVDRYPGVVIPPVPEKHAIGRFQEEFVEARRAALERFIRKVVVHPILQPDADVRLFLESETFSSDKRSDRKGGFIGAFTETTPQVNQPFPRVPDNETTLESRRIQSENLEAQLKALAKALELLMKQRRDLAQSILEMSDSLVGLANVEQSARLTRKLVRLSNIHKKIRDLQEKQAKEDLNHIFQTVEEHIRIIGSVKVAYSMRLKAYASFTTAEANLSKRLDALAKLEGSSKIRSDKIAVAKLELKEAEAQVEDSSKAFSSMTTLLIRELERVDREKIADFTEAMKLFLASMVQTQQQIIETWQSYFSDGDPAADAESGPAGATASG